MEQKGIQQIMELIAGLKALGLAGRAVMKDGKISVADLAVVPKLLEQQQVLVAAFLGLGELKDEVKNVSGDEAVQIVAALFAAAKEIKEA